MEEMGSDLHSSEPGSRSSYEFATSQVHSRDVSSSPPSPSSNSSGASSEYADPEESAAQLHDEGTEQFPDFEDIALNSRPASKINSAKPAVGPRQELSIQRPQTPPQAVSPEGSDYSGSPHASQRSPNTPTMPVSPITPQEARMSINSLHSLALSEVDYDYVQPEEPHEDVLQTPRVTRHSRKPSSLDILENVWSSTWSMPRRPTLTRPAPPTRQSTLFDITQDQPLTPTTPTNEADQKSVNTTNSGSQINGGHHDNQAEQSAANLNVMDTASVWRTQRFSSLGAPTHIAYTGEEDESELDWGNLDRTEEQEKVDKDLPHGAEDESTRFLLARLEQENAKFTSHAKSSTSDHKVGRIRSQTRPPSMAHLRRLVSKDAPSIRYSLVHDSASQLPEEPPPMTELEFWAALVQDYPSTASRLPTLTTTKIRAGIPPPLRGVVWTSMAGARDKELEEAFETLKDESSPYEGIINKDVGRSFPGVELFRDADGEGQRMLGRVLKCFSLHDKDIGYCQGLGFLVGPLLMNMGEKEAFCVLVRLMEHYALRPSFLPSLSGLHMRIFQFSSLLKQHHPALSEHLSGLGVEPAYLSQWFLSCFAVTCPLSMLFRIYDVIFAEGANETVMRVALALFRRNEEKMMASNEFEDIMQLLLGRSLWDVYAFNADDLVDDFTSLGNIITHARLAELEKEFENKDGDAVGQSAGFLPDVQAAASRFLGRLWAPNQGVTPSKAPSTSLSPQSAEKENSAYGYLAKTSTFLRKIPSKQSLGNIMDSASSESSGSASIASTAPTDHEVHDDAGRESQADAISMKSKPESMLTVSGSVSAHTHQLSISPELKEQELQSEIEDLLMALSELQREHAQMAVVLQKEREERNDDHRIVKQLLGKLTGGNVDQKTHVRMSSMPSTALRSIDETTPTKRADKRKTLPAHLAVQAKNVATESTKSEVVVKEGEEDTVDDLVQRVQLRLQSNARFSANFETRAQLRSSLARTREQLRLAEAQIKELSQRAEVAEEGLASYQTESEGLHAEVEELRTRVNDDFKAKKKLELTIENLQIQMRMEAKALEKKQRTVELSRSESSSEVPILKKADSPNRSRTGSLSSNPGSAGGLRELKLCKRDSGGSVTSIRAMKSQRHTGEEWPRPTPPALELAPSPPRSPISELPPIPPTPPAYQTIPQTSSLAVPAPSGPYFSRRTTSLAAQEVLATAQHEPIPDEALLLELVNAKTAEATARQEIDELRRSMQMQKRRADESMLELEAAVASAKLEAEQAKHEAEDARQEAREARAEVFDASELPTPLTPAVSFPVTPSTRDESATSPGSATTIFSSPVESAESKESDSSAAGLGGWFWNRRTGSTTTKVPGFSTWLESK